MENDETQLLHCRSENWYPIAIFWVLAAVMVWVLWNTCHVRCWILTEFLGEFASFVFRVQIELFQF